MKARDVAERQLAAHRAASGGNGDASTAREPAAGSAQSWQPFPVHALPEPVREFVDAASAAMGCDPAYVALPAIIACMSAIGNTRRVVLRRGSWTEPAVAWGGSIGESSTLKTPAMQIALQPFYDLQERALREHEGAMIEYSRLKNEYEIALKAWKAEGRAAGKPEPHAPREPICNRILIGDTTVEALIARLSDAPRGLLQARDELAGWLRSFGQYKAGRGGDCAHYLSMYNAGPVLLDRKTGDRTSAYVQRAAVSIVGCIQPEILRECLGREHFADGLAGRLLLVYPPRRPRVWTDRELPDEVRDAYGQVVEWLLDLRMKPGDDGRLQPEYVHLSRNGLAAFKAFFREHADEGAALVGDDAAAWSKLEAYCGRFALLIHCLRRAGGDITLADADLIDADSIERAAVLVRWFRREALRIYDLLHESDEARDRRRLVEWIASRRGAVTVRELRLHGPRMYRQSTELAREALDSLANGQLGRWTHPPPGTAGGRPTVRFELASAAQNGYGYETPTEGCENAGSVAVAAVPSIPTRPELGRDGDGAPIADPDGPPGAGFNPDSSEADADADTENENECRQS